MPPPPPTPKHRAEEEHGAVTRGSYRRVPSRPHGAETRGPSRPHGAETRGPSRPRQDLPDRGTHRAAKDNPGMRSSTGMDNPGMRSSTGVLVLQKRLEVGRAGTSSSREMSQDNPSMVKVGMSSSGVMSQKGRGMVKGGMRSQKCFTTVKGSTSSSIEMSQKCLAMVKGGTRSSEEMSQKCPANMKASMSFPQKNCRDAKSMHSLSQNHMALVITKPQVLREKKEADESDCAIQELNEQNKEEDEADQAIQQLNQLGLGEEISHDQYLVYLELLPCQSAYVDTSTKLHDTQLVDLDIRLALYRLKYAKMAVHGESDIKLKENCPPYFLDKNFECYEEGDSRLLSLLEEQGYYKNFEKNGLLDWSFHSDSYCLASLDDYQRIVPRYLGGFEYVQWDEYRSYFNSYEVENEYVNYCEELGEKLKWMEDYVVIKLSSLKWQRIFTRGAYQATKMATGFSKITWSLASNGYHEFLDNISFDVCWYKELDGVYFETWKRITKQKKCFRDALDEVYKLNKFPLRQSRMKRALDTDCSKMEKEFCACTEGIAGEVTDEKAQELIAEAVKKLRGKPKFYEHYIRKKIDIARDIGVIVSGQVQR